MYCLLMMIVYSISLVPGEPNMPERIILALKLSSTVHGTNTSCRGRQQTPAAAAKESDVGPDHEICQNLSQFCGHQEVCGAYIPPFRYVPPGISVSFTHRVHIDCVYMQYVCNAPQSFVHNR